MSVNVTANGPNLASGQTAANTEHAGTAQPENKSLLRPIKYEYDMNHQHRGLAIIFNHYAFEYGLGMKFRNGTNKDCASLKSTFESLGFTVQLHNDLCLYQVYDVLEKGNWKKNCLQTIETMSSINVLFPTFFVFSIRKGSY